MAQSYHKQWQDYPVRHRNLVLLLIAEFVGTIPFLVLVAFVDRKVFSGTSLVMPSPGYGDCGISRQGFDSVVSVARDAARTFLEASLTGIATHVPTSLGTGVFLLWLAKVCRLLVGSSTSVLEGIACQVLRSPHIGNWLLPDSHVP